MRRFAIIFGSCAAFYLLLFHLFRTFTDVSNLRTEFPHVIYDAKNQSSQIEMMAKRPPQWTPLTAVSPLAVAAIVLSEDWAFWQHNGFDWDQLLDALETNWKKGKFARGGSTITQQVVKNVYLSRDKTIWRKVQEAVLTMRVERHVSKKRILEVYLNVAEFGPGLYGVGPAARFYFQKSAAELTAKEGAFLAMLLPSPKRYSVSFRKKQLSPYARGTVRSILSKLLATKRISQADYEQAIATPFSFEVAAVAPQVVETPEDEDEAPEETLPAESEAGEADLPPDELSSESTQQPT